MRKIADLFVLIISTLILLTAMDQSFINRVKQDRYFDHLSPGENKNTLYHRLFVRSDRWRYGDLYGLCFLPRYKYALKPFKKYYPVNKKAASNKMLYIIGDSFLADKTLVGAFENFDNVVLLDRRFPFGPICLDSTKQNYLLMEFAERNLNRYDLNKTGEVKWSSPDISSKTNFSKNNITSSVGQALPASLLDRLNKILFNKDLSRNIELLLFDDKLFTSLKEAKAVLNYNLFGRIAKEVAVSTDKKRLFLNITVDTANTESAFRPISDKEINQIAANLTAARQYYLSIGFKKVYVSVIPNSVSIYDDKRLPYNHLAQRIEKETTLPAISVFQTYKDSKTNLFYLSDAHWNPTGFDLWIQQTNNYFQNH